MNLPDLLVDLKTSARLMRNFIKWTRRDFPEWRESTVMHCFCMSITGDVESKFFPVNTSAYVTIKIQEIISRDYEYIMQYYFKETDPEFETAISEMLEVTAARLTDLHAQTTSSNNF